jgi:cbb3-type cytochrome oxidase maturation protein
MDSLYLLIPLSLLLILLIGGLLAWSVMSGQLDELEGEGRRILDDEPAPGPHEKPR